MLSRGVILTTRSRHPCMNTASCWWCAYKRCWQDSWSSWAAQTSESFPNDRDPCLGYHHWPLEKERI